MKEPFLINPPKYYSVSRGVKHSKPRTHSSKHIRKHTRKHSSNPFGTLRNRSKLSGLSLGLSGLSKRIGRRKSVRKVTRRPIRKVNRNILDNMGTFFRMPTRKKSKQKGGVKMIRHHRRVRRNRAKVVKRHRPVLYGSGKTWSRGAYSRSGAAGISINRKRRKHHKKHAKRRLRRNPGMLIAGANPFVVRRRHRKNRVHHRRHRMHRNRRHFRRNPALNYAGFDFLRQLPLIATGGASIIAIVTVPRLLSITNANPIMYYGTQAAVVVGGGFGAKKFLKSQDYANAWMLAGSAAILADVVKNYVLPTILPNLFPAGLGSIGSIGAFPRLSDYSEVSGIDAFPTTQYQTIDVYPTSGNEGPY